MSINFVEICSQNQILKNASPSSICTCLTEDSLSVEKFKCDEQIAPSEDKCKRIGIIISGIATVTPLSSSHNAMLRTMSANDMFGVSNLYSDDSHFPSVIVAKTDVTVLFINGDAFKRLLGTDADAMRAYLSFLSKKIIYLNKKISTLTAPNAEKKLALFLCDNEHNGEFISSLSMSALADVLNVGRATLYRSLDTLSEMGLIVRSGKKIIIPDKNALLKFI